MARKAMLIDITRCIGCGLCRDACKEQNGLPAGEETKLNANAYTVVQDYGHDVYVRRLCMHCEVPTCVSVCPVGAFTKTADGPVLYEESKCIGCRYCMQACPYQVPTYTWDQTEPRVRKCIFCHSRLAQGLPTACAEACPTGATIFGDREELIAEAQRRLREEPEKYVDHIYGLTEAGGSSVFFLSAIPFEQLGFPGNLPKHPLPLLTWNALSKIPDIVAVGGTALYGLWWIINRRDEVGRLHAKLKEMEDRKE
ncbi:MAG: 4Fe-4S dicluster domain-containing protein [candidate division KSB1 bacterium]|nr:4Fe-4S dicluster domain-containing protein [candidate division KSB1 bacterium]MDZ7274284.1 4Fe-4S dicluster domain-containing protein [candidate division KSB1 bacterium]MDZ7287194.1 4Fe-4S dicluster domain-containing protein [candidate division KSB1 bacterium]MDZ7296881.1 4Fe-4S dicluster domain-containing protein [candidate division KSB1 bacterium]MDZ7306014.1 4Fe-4S dicluster domain-containing protein [candidate division KSB1 bacterium]